MWMMESALTVWHCNIQREWNNNISISISSLCQKAHLRIHLADSGAFSPSDEKIQNKRRCVKAAAAGTGDGVEWKITTSSDKNPKYSQSREGELGLKKREIEVSQDRNRPGKGKREDGEKMRENTGALFQRLRSAGRAALTLYLRVWDITHCKLRRRWRRRVALSLPFSFCLSLPSFSSGRPTWLQSFYLRRLLARHEKREAKDEDGER